MSLNQTYGSLYHAVFLAERSGLDGRVLASAVASTMTYTGSSMKEAMEFFSRSTQPDVAGREIVEVTIVKRA